MGSFATGTGPSSGASANGASTKARSTHLATANAFEILFGAPRVRIDLNTGIAPLILAHHVFRQTAGHGSKMAQSQVARRPFGQGASNLGRVVGSLYDRPPRSKKALSCEFDAPALALQELEPELTLEPANLLAQCWLRDEQALRSSGEVELLRNHGEIAKIAQLPCADAVTSVPSSAKLARRPASVLARR
jgi:hypothetical protein